VLEASAGELSAMSEIQSKSHLDALIQTLGVLVIDDNQYMRKVTRNLLMNIGVRAVYEAGDGIAGLDVIRTLAPDVVILDWHLPLLNGAEFVRIVRSPGVFPMADIPDRAARRLLRAGAAPAFSRPDPADRGRRAAGRHSAELICFAIPISVIADWPLRGPVMAGTS
jgi:CheY-like chemotaxis protein